MDLGKSFEKSNEGYETLGWVLYWGTVGASLLGLIPVFAVLSLVIYLGILVLAFIRSKDAEGTLYESHFRNVLTVGVVSFVGALILLLVTIGTLGFGAIITIPAWIVLLLWAIYRIIKGMLRLKEKAAFR
jgi:uncharacterized membrane protein